MGLTIHYTIGFKGNAEALVSKLQTIKSQCMDMPFEDIREISHKTYSKEDIQFFRDIEKEVWYPNNTPENIQSAKTAYQERGLDRGVMIDIQVYHPMKTVRPVEFVKWALWAGKGCEGTTFTFVKKRNRWNCVNFTKTQYAEQFVKCHLLVIQVLDLFKEQGFEVEVKDEGEYWETRDLTVLAKNINDYTTLLKNMLGPLSEEAQKAGMTVEAPITECQNYMKIKDSQ